ncbi:MIP family channel protein [Romboutsia sedimentorum]|uniref:MIP family channel protein n=1 Tax=Romboutsia sedimentorum TaxID=1368474 RepID=A0ABT7EDI6_9FIRM|nr:MIP family channel protein [Romboutsia sedimentorum]MDK2564991.1 MIP family channel protein [Romboutsia sedimentorum]MDK2585491.1 MIP family channel protein [Romboutsia sedimentorum]
MKKTLVGECISEFIGSWILIFIGCGAVASMVLSGASISQWEIGIIWGLAVTMAIYITGAVSGTHINPAVTIALMVHRDFPKKKVLPYIVSQVLGCFVGAATVYFLFKNLFISFESTNNIVRASSDGLATAGIFSTYPNAALSSIEALFVEILITMFLVMVILAVGDAKNSNRPHANLAPVMIGLTIAILGGSFGVLTGFAMNPARDLGPKLFAVIAGWGSDALGPNMYFWVPIVGPIIGAVIAGFVFDKGVKKYMDEEESLEEVK